MLFFFGIYICSKYAFLVFNKWFNVLEILLVFLMCLVGILKVLVSMMKLGLLFKIVLLWCVLKKSDCYCWIMFKCWLLSNNILIGNWLCLIELSFWIFIINELLLVIKIIGFCGWVFVILIVVGKLKFIVLKFVEVM